MQCPSCKEQIDDDSCFCDLCGEQIMVCTVCGRPGKGKRCIFDGKEMVAAGDQPVPSAPVTTKTPTPTAVPVQSPPQSASFANGGVASDTVRFSGNGIMFEAKDGDVIGRKTGPFAGIFAAQSYVSGTHCKVVKMPSGWHIQDLDSTNGTFVQGNKLAPNVPYSLLNNTTVKIATTDFTVTFDDGESTTRL